MFYYIKFNKAFYLFVLCYDNQVGKSYYTYILLCADESFYCGFTDNLEKRLAAHNAGKGGKYTRSRLPVKFLTSVKFDNEHDARSCEWWFKHKLTHPQKEALILTNTIESAYQKRQKKS